MRLLATLILLVAVTAPSCASGPTLEHGPLQLHSGTERRSLIGAWESRCDGEGPWRYFYITSHLTVTFTGGVYRAQGRVHIPPMTGVLELSSASEDIGEEGVLFTGELWFEVGPRGARERTAPRAMTLYIERGRARHRGELREQRSAYEVTIICEFIWSRARSDGPPRPNRVERR